MTPINFSLPGFFKKTGAGVSEFNEDAPPITDDLLTFFDPEYAVFSDEGNTLAQDGDNIRQIWDRSSTGNTLNQTTASSQPIYDTTTFGNGIASIKSINDSLIPTTALDFDNSTSWTWYHVYKKASHSNIYYWFRGTVGYPRTEHRTTLFNIRGNTGSGRYVNYTDNTDTKIMAITVDRSANEFKMYINGSYIGASVSSVTNWPVTIGKLYGNGNAIMNVGNALFYTAAHDAAQVLQVSEWLGDKYDLLVAPITENLEFYINPDKEVYSDAGTTLATDGDSIRQINDLSGNDNTIEQATASHQFEYVEDHFGTGKAAIHKDTAHGPHMDFASTLSIDSATTGGITFYTVYDKTNLSTISYLFGTTDGNFNRILEYNNFRLYIQDTDGDSHFASFTNASDLAIRAFTLDTSTDTISTYENGVLVDSSYKSKTWGTFNFDSFWGSANTSYIGDTLLFSDVHDVDQVKTMSDWLNTKYEIYDAYAPPITDDLEIYFNPDFDVYSDAGTTLATDGDNIRQYNDRSGNDNTAEQTTGSKQPVYSTSTLGNNNASIHIDSTNVFDLTSGITVGSSSHFTFYTVFKRSAGTRNSAIGADGADRIDLRDSYIQTFDSSTNSFEPYSWSTDLVIITVVVDSSDNSYKVYENGTQVGATNTRTFGQFDFNQLHGGENAGGNIDYGITLMYNGVAHDSTDVGTISDWLNDKYDIY